MYELLYVSALAPATAVSEIAGIVRHARMHNAVLGVTGILIFDGARFCQYLEGEEATVCALARHIEADPRHTGFVVRHAGRRAHERRISTRPLSYALALDESDMDAIVAAVGPASVAMLAATLPRLDLDP